MDTRIDLIDVQPEIAARADELYRDKRFVGIVLSTGGGKSFLAMDRIIKQVNEHNERTQFDDSDPLVLSNCPILYFSPTNIVNGQFRTHMAKYVIAPEYLRKDLKENGPLTPDNAPQTLTRLLIKLKIDPGREDRNRLIHKLQDAFYADGVTVDPEEALLKILREELERAETSVKDKIVHDAFPNIHFKAYKNLDKLNPKDRQRMEEEYEETLDEESEPEQITDINSIRPELIIFDEAHRTGAPTWWPRIESYIGRNQAAKVLAITATPERDVDEQDMMKQLAAIPGMGYSVRERRERQYLAGNYPLMEAIKIGIVNPPDVIHFNMTLDETTEFKDMLERFIKAVVEDETADSHKFDKYAITKGKTSRVYKAFGDMLVQIRKNPFEDDKQTTIDRIEGIRDKLGFVKSEEEKGLLTHLRDHIKNLHFEQGIPMNDDGISTMLESCIEYLENDIWEDGKPWKQVKQERISRLITTELEKRGLAHGKALTFIDSMGQSKEKNESSKSKRKRALAHISSEIDRIKNRIGLIMGIEPSVCAIHSTAYTPKENEVILDRFMRESTDQGPFKIIASVQKFNEGFHPDGIGAEFMIKEITENENKEGEPRIVLLQQLGRVLSAGSKDRAVVFDLANNFMRNHSRFFGEIEQDLDCYRFLDLTEEERIFLEAADTIRDNSRTRNVVDHHVDETIKILSVIMKRVLTVDVDLNMPLKTLIGKIGNETLRNKILDELYLKGIELEDHGDINIGEGLQHIKDVIWDVKGGSDAKVFAAINGMSLQELKNLGILDDSERGLKEFEKLRRTGKKVVDRHGFIVGGKLPQFYRYNIFTGTLYDGPENDPTSIDYYGCRPDGYDPAGYDRYGFNREGIHKVTGMPFDEKMFTRLPDGRWVNLLRERGSEKEELDLLGFNHDGINPDTGFDRDGFWHKKLKDGTFSEVRSRFDGNKLDVHEFSAQGHYRKAKNVLSKNGLFSNGTRYLNPSNARERGEIYGNDDFDIDGFDRSGFNRNGVNKQTSLKYNLEGRDESGRLLDPELSFALEMVERIRRRGIENIRGKTPEEIGEVIAKGIALSRIYYNIKKGSNDDIMQALSDLPEHRLKEIMNLPIGTSGRTIREMNQGFTEYLKNMNRFYKQKEERFKGKNTDLELQYKQLSTLLMVARRPVEELFRPNETKDDFIR